VSVPTLDALVIGGGPSGATAALLLAKAGWSVGVVEKASFPRHKVCGEFLSAASLPLLRELGVTDAFSALAGPPVTRIGVFSGDQVVTAAMTQAPDDEGRAVGCGRALGRDHLDTLLLDRARAMGTRVWQPWSAVELVKVRDGYVCTAVDRVTRRSQALKARLVVAAHGSWDPGSLPTQPPRPAPRDCDLFGFKGHFLESRFPVGLMALLTFPGGYGGMVHSDHGRVSLSCCIRYDELQRARRVAGVGHAAEAVLAHVRKSCRAVDDALQGAALEHEWSSAGPIRPGIRRRTIDGVFLVGNAAGEAHPAIAEGIGMAMHSASELCRRLTSESFEDGSCATVDATRRDYPAAWRRSLGARVRVGGLIAHWAMAPAAVALTVPLLQLLPGALARCARLSGKNASFASS
jgi:menaquinone-9 beta-reductase